ncbi:MAG: hypothetical protein PHU36_07670 [Syntrophomonadaceae bacterium]|nr:hypothetical protein [Syntrophomonadaceae bacterium]
MKILYKKALFVALTILFFCLSLITTAPYISTAEALDPNLSAFNRFTHSAWSANYGLKSFVYKSDYLAQQTSDSTNKKVNYHDWIAYKCPSDGIYNPEVGNGAAGLYQIYMVDTNGNLYSPITGSNFVNGSYYSRLLCGSAYYFAAGKSSTQQSASNSRTYQNRVETWFQLDNSWTPFFWTGDYIWTQQY